MSEILVWKNHRSKPNSVTDLSKAMETKPADSRKRRRPGSERCATRHCVEKRWFACSRVFHIIQFQKDSDCSDHGDAHQQTDRTTVKLEFPKAHAGSRVTRQDSRMAVLGKIVLTPILGLYSFNFTEAFSIVAIPSTLDMQMQARSSTAGRTAPISLNLTRHDLEAATDCKNGISMRS